MSTGHFSYIFYAPTMHERNCGTVFELKWKSIYRHKARDHDGANDASAFIVVI